MGEYPQRRLGDYRNDPHRAEEVDVPRVHFYGERGYLQAAAQGVFHLRGGTCTLSVQDETRQTQNQRTWPKPLEVQIG